MNATLETPFVSFSLVIILFHSFFCPFKQKLLCSVALHH